MNPHSLSHRKRAETAPPCWAASGPRVGNTVEPLAHRDMVFMFENGQSDLSPAEKSLLNKWLRRCDFLTDNARVCIGGALETSRIGRMRRLSSLIRCFVKYGIQRRDLQLDGGWTLPTRIGACPQLPSDVIWMQIR